MADLIVFLAQPVSNVTDSHSVNKFTLALSRSFTKSGWIATPKAIGQARGAADCGPIENGRLLSSNIEGILSSDLVVIVAAAATEPTSIWVELGVALGAGVPILLVTPVDRPIPFLARVAGTTLPHSKWSLDRLEMQLPTTSAQLELAVDRVVWSGSQLLASRRCHAADISADVGTGALPSGRLEVDLTIHDSQHGPT